MGIFFTLFSVLLFGLLSIHAIAQEVGETKAHELIEIEATEGRILVFPSPLPGNEGPIRQESSIFFWNSDIRIEKNLNFFKKIE